MIATTIHYLVAFYVLQASGISVQCEQGLHYGMSKFELARHFGVTSPEQVHPDSYEVVTISKEVRNDKVSKRNGKDHSSNENPVFKLRAFGKDIKFVAKRNKGLLHPNATIATVDGPETRISWAVDDEFPESDCHYLSDSESESYVGGLSDCNGEAEGYFADAADIISISPMNRIHNPPGMENESLHIAHKKSISSMDFKDKIAGLDIKPQNISTFSKRGGNRSPEKIIEIAVFLGPFAFKPMLKYLGSEKKVREMLLTFVNGMQSLYNYPSLGHKVDFVIVYMELMKTWEFNGSNGQREQLLKNFCKYQASKNPESDSNVKHWDIALFLSGLDFWANSGGKRSYNTMGLATVTGICTKKYGCVIGEIGVSSEEGAPYPSTGFTSIYVMAHEIGHNLGMTHDGSGNNCPKDGFIMSGSRGTKGETRWSRCSADFIANLDMKCLTDRQNPVASIGDHNKYGDRPGSFWSADEQCQFLLQNKAAKTDHTSSNMEDVCFSLRCRVSGKKGYWRAGPALDGTHCHYNENKICLYGSCVENDQQPISSAMPEWTEWSEGPCLSGCIVRSTGVIEKNRVCNVPKPLPITTRCPGIDKKVGLCSNYPKCKKVYKVSEWASGQCQEYMNRSHRLRRSILAEGHRARYNRRKPEVACMVFCKRANGGQYYSPVIELNNFKDIDPYFPDGSWCHNDGSTDYYCLKHKCTSITRGAKAESSKEIEVNQNAKPEDSTTTEIYDYFVINEDGQSQGDSIPKQNEENDDVEFTQDDGITPEELERSE